MKFYRKAYGTVAATMTTLISFSLGNSAFGQTIPPEVVACEKSQAAFTSSVNQAISPIQNLLIQDMWAMLNVLKPQTLIDCIEAPQGSAGIALKISALRASLSVIPSIPSTSKDSVDHLVYQVPLSGDTQGRKISMIISPAGTLILLDKKAENPLAELEFEGLSSHLIYVRSDGKPGHGDPTHEVASSKLNQFLKGLKPNQFRPIPLDPETPEKLILPDQTKLSPNAKELVSLDGDLSNIYTQFKNPATERPALRIPLTLRFLPQFSARNHKSVMPEATLSMNEFAQLFINPKLWDPRQCVAFPESRFPVQRASLDSASQALQLASQSLNQLRPSALNAEPVITPALRSDKVATRNENPTPAEVGVEPIPPASATGIATK